jgi:hypothetical protein
MAMIKSITAGQWSSLTPLPEAKSNGWLLSEGRNLYYVGGTTNASATGSPQVYQALVGGDGSIGAWSHVATVPKYMGFFSGVLTEGNMILAGGNTVSPVNSVYVAPMQPGQPGSFTYMGVPISSFRNPGVAYHNGRIYYVGGNTTAANGKQVWIGQFSLQSGVSTWTPGPDLPSGRQAGVAFVHRGHLFYAGGSTTGAGSGAIAEVISAKINGDGSLEPWKAAGNMPVALHRFAGVVYHDRLLILGGQDTSLVNSGKMYHAKINGDGTLDEFFEEEVALPMAHRNSCAAVVGNRLYLASGFTTVRLANVWTIPLQF